MSMASASLSYVRASSSSPIRPMHIPRDLGAVADLIELCFQNTLDSDGRLYVSRMRSAARRSGSWDTLLDFGASDWQSTGLPAGFVWEENGRIVGNLSLIAFSNSLFGWGEKTHLIANVAVHPDFRRKGIARALTQTALKAVQISGGPLPWLHVRDDNPAALALYLSLGFEEQYRRTTWHSRVGDNPPGLPRSDSHPVFIRSHHGSDWKKQPDWFLLAYPHSMSFYLPIHVHNLRPGFLGILYRSLNDIYLRQWSAEQAGELRGCVAWQPTRTFADNLWLAVDPLADEIVTETLLYTVLERFYNQRPLALDYPAGLAFQALQSTGFHLHHTLIWMRASGSGNA